MAAGRLWVVVGGADKGGILVREACDTASVAADERLGFCALVREKELNGERLCYELAAGRGPPTGWVSLRLASGRALLVEHGQVWKVVGGEEKGGILVREGPGVASAPLAERLSCGAWVRELELPGDRLHFERLTGQGPGAGWVSTRLQSGKDLLLRFSPADADQAAPLPGEAGAGGPSQGGGAADGGAQQKEWSPYEALGVPTDATDAVIKSTFRKLSLKVHPDRCPDDPDAAAKFLALTEAKDFLLDARRRRDYNMAHGLLQQQLNVTSARWWSDWDYLFDEFDASADADEAAEAPTLATQEAPIAEARIDIVVLGATGLTGMLICSLLVQQTSGRTWAVAGRCGWKLDLVAKKFGRGPFFRGATRVETEADVEQLARTARILIDVTGPKWQIGGMVARACVRSGTHYVENTGVPGDILAAKGVMEACDEPAKAAGVILLYCCGWSSVWVDFGVWLVVKHLRETYGAPTLRVDEWRAFQGFNVGGTHLLGVRGPDNFDQLLREAGGPFPLGGCRHGGVRKEDMEFKGVKFDQYFEIYAINGLPPDKWVSRCSCGLFDLTEPYGDRYNQQTWEVHPDRNSAHWGQASAHFMRAGYDQNLATGKIPGPGQGPKERIRRESSAAVALVAEADEEGEERHRAYCVVNPGSPALNDPYECSATTLVEAASCLLDALDSGAQLRPGFGTPVWHLAHLGFVERLRARGASFTVVDGFPPADMVRGLYGLSAMSQAIDG